MYVSCVLESGCCCLFVPLFFSFFFLSNFQTLRFFVTLFSGAVRPRRLTLGTHVDSGQIYHIYRNQAVALIHPSISSFFFLSNFQTLKYFVTLFSGTVRPKIFKLGTLVDNGWMYRVYQIGTAVTYLPLCFFIFLSVRYQLWGLESWNLVHMWTMSACIVYTGIRLLLLICPFIGPFFFLSNFQLQICLSPLIAL